jgi:hypothetical protein
MFYWTSHGGTGPAVSHITRLYNGIEFCCQNQQKGGVFIFVCKDLYFAKINISHNFKEKDLEICATELETKSSKLITLSLYRVPRGDFIKFVKNLDNALKCTLEPKRNF